MEKFSAVTSPQPEVNVEADTDLNVKGWNESQVLVKTSGNKSEEVLSATENNVKIKCSGDCTIYVPLEAKINVQFVGRDVSLKSLKGGVTIDQIGRDLTLRDVGSVTAGAIGRDIDAKRIHGDFKVESVGRGVIARNVGGQFAAETIGAHLYLRDVSAGVSAQVGGNAEITLAPVSWQAYSIKAAGNINCRLPEDANAEISITSGANQIQLKLPQQRGSYNEHNRNITLGDGGAPLALAAGGAVILRTSESDWGASETPDLDVDINADIESLTNSIEQHISEQIDLQLGAIENQLETQLEGLSDAIGKANLSEDERERFGQHVATTRQRSQAHAQKLTEHIRAKINSKIDTAKQKARQKAAQYAARPIPPLPPLGPMPPSRSAVDSDPVSDEERMLILNMLESGKITAEDAEQLLAALENASRQDV